MASAPASSPCPASNCSPPSPTKYRAETLGGALPKVAVEAGVRDGWDRWIGPEGGFVGMTGFGASAPYKALYKHFGITPESRGEGREGAHLTALLAHLTKCCAELRSFHRAFLSHRAENPLLAPA